MSEISTREPSSRDVPADPRTSLDVLDQLLKPEVQQSLTMLIEQLPKLSEMAVAMGKAYDFAHAVMTDTVLVEDLTGGVRDFLQPVKEKIKELAVVSMEAGERAKTDDTQFGVFGLLRLLKDPQVQHGLRFAEAFLNVLAENKQNKK